MDFVRRWMYDRIVEGRLTADFRHGVEEFINFALLQTEYLDGLKIRCPCRKCENKKFHVENEVRDHLYRKGFVENYYRWIWQGEPNENVPSPNVDFEQLSPMHQMIHNVAGTSFVQNDFNPEEEPNPSARKLYDLLDSADKELWPGCDEYSQLSAVAELLSIKSDYHLPESCFDRILQFSKRALPKENILPDSFYNTKKLVKGLGLPVEKIECCMKGCMIYWGEDANLQNCKSCALPRYKEGKNKLVAYQKMYYFPITPRLQRLYASEATASHMRWHDEHEQDDEVMRHCCHGEAWKYFNLVHPSFAADSRNVRLGLSTDGFQPFGQSGQQYSSWPIIVTPYNLPPSMCMKEPYMFLTVIVPGPRNPKQRIDVYLQPLIAELINLWEFGVDAYDVSRKQNFVMRAALMWTISDFPAYSMLSGWSTSGKLACPHCMENSESFYLENGKKISWFDCHRKFLPSKHRFRRNKTDFKKGRSVYTQPPPHLSSLDVLNQIDRFGFKKITEIGGEVHNVRNCAKCGWKKRSILWDLPYWNTLLIRHNLDVMHIEKNVFENVFNTVMDIEGRTKDTLKARKDLAIICHRPELNPNATNGGYAKAAYTLSKEQKKMLCEWLKGIRFPDGYVSNLGRCVDMNKYKLFGMKSHDCHVFMQRLLPIAFREFLPVKVWETLTELSLFFKDLTCTELKKSVVKKLEEEIPFILCKLELIFPPSFFDSMEHLLVHLPLEARLGGPVQYRWMYPFER